MTPPPSNDSPLSQLELDQGLLAAWLRADHDEARAWLELGADPMSEPAPLLSNAINNRDIEMALALAPHRWRESGSQAPEHPAYPPLICCIHHIYHQNHTRPEDPGARLLELLLSLGADPNQNSGFSENISALRLAVTRNALHAAKTLIQSGAHIHERQARSSSSPERDGDTLLHSAVRSWDTEMAQLLIDAGLDPKAPNDAGLTPEDLVDGLSGRPAERLRAFFAGLERDALDQAAGAAPGPRPCALRM